MKEFATILLTVVITLSSSVLLAQDRPPTTARLGGMIVGPGTSTTELVQRAGEPIRREDVGINMTTGEYRQRWIYPYASMTAVLHISGTRVTQVELLRSPPK